MGRNKYHSLTPIVVVAVASIIIVTFTISIFPAESALSSGIAHNSTTISSSTSGKGQFKGPVAVAVDHMGNVYVADYGNNRIQKFNSNGTFITTWGELGSGNKVYFHIKNG
ncbi:MAG TPA: hypothetical protein VEH06_15875 [Candidatus Bathyarchaeia archaeon]|nr:hypothetical protein [Candidatus Bathyarchaeia archaeon]